MVEVNPDQAQIAASFEDKSAEIRAYTARILATMFANADASISCLTPAGIARATGLTTTAVLDTLRSTEFQTAITEATHSVAGGLVLKLVALTEENIKDFARNQRLVNETMKTLVTVQERVSKAVAASSVGETKEDLVALLKTLKPINTQTESKIQHVRDQSHPAPRGEQLRSDPSSEEGRED